MFFSKIFNFFSSLVQPFYLSFRSISTIHGGVSRRNSQIMKTEEEFSLNLAPFSSRFVVLVQGHPLIIVLIVSILFTYPEHFMSCFPFLSSEGHLFKYYSFQLAAHILQILPVHQSNIL